MSLYRRNPRRDASEQPIIQALKKKGWTVLQISVRNGPDLAVAKNDRVVMVECKSGRAKLRPGQIDWLDRWPGEIAVLRTVEDAIKL